MSRGTVELDFFGMEKDSKSQFQKFLHRQRTFRGMQTSAISKINPQLLKSVIASGSVNKTFSYNGLPVALKKSFSVPSTPKGDQNLLPPLPVYTIPTVRPTAENVQETAPMTIFYNGTVAVFDISQDKVESILKLAAAEGNSKNKPETISSKLEIPSSEQQQLLDGDLPIARRMSLQRFLEKRKERLTWATPYYASHA